MSLDGTIKMCLYSTFGSGLPLTISRSDSVNSKSKSSITTLSTSIGSTKADAGVSSPLGPTVTYDLGATMTDRTTSLLPELVDEAAMVDVYATGQLLSL